jgi:Zn finger protein HypA/HybF involved in hydrogenase expression
MATIKDGVNIGIGMFIVLPLIIAAIFIGIPVLAFILHNIGAAICVNASTLGFGLIVFAIMFMIVRFLYDKISTFLIKKKQNVQFECMRCKEKLKIENPIPNEKFICPACKKIIIIPQAIT